MFHETHAKTASSFKDSANEIGERMLIQISRRWIDYLFLSIFCKSIIKSLRRASNDSYSHSCNLKVNVVNKDQYFITTNSFATPVVVKMSDNEQTELKAGHPPASK